MTSWAADKVALDKTHFWRESFTLRGTVLISARSMRVGIWDICIATANDRYWIPSE